MKTAKLSWLLLIVVGFSLQAYAQCSNASLNGTFFYTLGGSVKSGATTASYDELGKVVADGNGNLSGTTTTSIAGVLATLPVTGTYTVKSDCSGTGTLTTSADTLQFTLQLVSGGGTILMSITSSSVGSPR
jgi:hypothetical protein